MNGNQIKELASRFKVAENRVSTVVSQLQKKIPADQLLDATIAVFTAVQDGADIKAAIASVANQYRSTSAKQSVAGLSKTASVFNERLVKVADKVGDQQAAAAQIRAMQRTALVLQGKAEIEDPELKQYVDDVTDSFFTTWEEELGLFNPLNCQPPALLLPETSQPKRVEQPAA